jgi:hypothetical protein
MYFDTLKIIPREIHVNNTLVPPIVTRGKVNPVAGTRFRFTAILARACTVSIRLRPMAKNAPNALGLWVTSRTFRKNNST